MILMFTAALFVPSLAVAQDAAEAAAPATQSPLMSLAPLVLIFFVFYFVLIKPQQKRMKEHQSMLGALKKGDEVVTGGGIVGRITKVSTEVDTVVVEIAKGVEVSVLKSTLTGLVSAVKASAKAGNVKNDNTVPSRDSVANDN